MTPLPVKSPREAPPPTHPPPAPDLGVPVTERTRDPLVAGLGPLPLSPPVPCLGTPVEPERDASIVLCP